MTHRSRLRRVVGTGPLSAVALGALLLGLLGCHYRRVDAFATATPTRRS
jgi:hypothetical protein